MNNQDFHFGRWISILFRYRQSYISKKLVQLNIGSGQYVILVALFKNDGISQEELSDYLKIDKGSIAKSIKKLEDEAYIKRDIDNEDKRAYKIYLTNKAKDIMPVIFDAISSWEDMIKSDLTEEEEVILENLLSKMAKKSCDLKANIEEKTANGENKI